MRLLSLEKTVATFPTVKGRAVENINSVQLVMCKATTCTCHMTEIQLQTRNYRQGATKEVRLELHMYIHVASDV